MALNSNQDIGPAGYYIKQSEIHTEKSRSRAVILLDRNALELKMFFYYNRFLFRHIRAFMSPGMCTLSGRPHHIKHVSHSKLTNKQNCRKKH